jgi:putative protease
MEILPELLSPAGDLFKLQLALEYGADAVYVGAAGLSMRPDNASFNIDELHRAVELTHGYGKKIYVGINTILFQNDLSLLEQWIENTKHISFNALILADPGALTLVKTLRPDVEIHLSTQMSTSNTLAANFWKEVGVKRVILSRECSLSDIKLIAQESNIEVETFIHGAMCVAISGRCLLSAHLCGNSASKGECKQTCRWEWQLVEEKRPGQTIPVFQVGKKTIFLGSTDLCLIRHIPALVKSRVRALKIEGRMKSAYYVAAVTRIYRAALNTYASAPEKYCVEPWWIEELEAISHRPYAEGFADGYPSDQPQSLQTFNHPISTCETVGYLKGRHHGFYAIEVKNPFAVGDTIEWIGPEMTGGSVIIRGIYTVDGEEISQAISSTIVHVELQSDHLNLPTFAIFRRRIG